MKRYLKHPNLLVFILILSFSCDNEPLEGDFPDSGNETTQPSTGDYWPMEIGNNWIYNNDVDGQLQENTEMIIGGLVTYEGNQQYKYSQFMTSTTGTDGTEFENMNVDIYTRKDGGNYFISIGEINADYLGVYELSQEGYSYVTLKDYLNVGETWSTSVSFNTNFTSTDGSMPSMSFTTNIDMHFEIIEKDASVTVNGVEYSPVIQVKTEQNSTTTQAPGQSISNVTYYYFAKDVGIIKAITNSNDVADGIESTSVFELESYSLN